MASHLQWQVTMRTRFEPTLNPVSILLLTAWCFLSTAVMHLEADDGVPIDVPVFCEVSGATERPGGPISS